MCSCVATLWVGSGNWFSWKLAEWISKDTKFHLLHAWVSLTEDLPSSTPSPAVADSTCVGKKIRPCNCRTNCLHHLYGVSPQYIWYFAFVYWNQTSELWSSSSPPDTTEQVNGCPGWVDSSLERVNMQIFLISSCSAKEPNVHSLLFF